MSSPGASSGKEEVGDEVDRPSIQLDERSAEQSEGKPAEEDLGDQPRASPSGTAEANGVDMQQPQELSPRSSIGDPDGASVAVEPAAPELHAAAEEMDDARRRYAAPYDYPPEPLVVQGTADVVLGIPIEPPPPDGGDGEVNSSPPGFGAGGPFSALFPMDLEGAPAVRPEVLAMQRAIERLSTEMSFKMVLLHRRSLLTRHVAIIQMIILCVGAFATLYFLLLLPLPLVLYGTARRWSMCGVCVGMVGFPIVIAMKIWTAVRLVDEFSDRVDIAIGVVCGCLCVVDLLGAFVTARFVAALHRYGTAPVLQRFHDGWELTSEEIERAARYTELERGGEHGGGSSSSPQAAQLADSPTGVAS